LVSAATAGFSVRERANPDANSAIGGIKLRILFPGVSTLAGLGLECSLNLVLLDPGFRITGLVQILLFGFVTHHLGMQVSFASGRFLVFGHYNSPEEKISTPNPFSLSERIVESVLITHFITGCLRFLTSIRCI
jgi:hypothetical protein